MLLLDRDADGPNNLVHPSDVVSHSHTLYGKAVGGEMGCSPTEYKPFRAGGSWSKRRPVFKVLEKIDGERHHTLFSAAARAEGLSCHSPGRSEQRAQARVRP